jgi:hypothetical protein
MTDKLPTTYVVGARLSSVSQLTLIEWCSDLSLAITCVNAKIMKRSALLGNGAMEESPDRFSCLLEPTGAWTVWDDVTGEPATLGGKILMGCTRERAESARDVLARIYKNGLDARPAGHFRT